MVAKQDAELLEKIPEDVRKSFEDEMADKYEPNTLLRWIQAVRRCGMFEFADIEHDDIRGHWAVMCKDNTMLIEAKTLLGRRLLGLLHSDGDAKVPSIEYGDAVKRFSGLSIERVNKAMELLGVIGNDRVLVKVGEDKPVFLGTLDFNFWIAPVMIGEEWNTEPYFEYDQKWEKPPISDTGEVKNENVSEN